MTTRMIAIIIVAVTMIIAALHIADTASTIAVAHNSKAAEIMAEIDK